MPTLYVSKREIIRLYKSGLTLQEVGDAMKCSANYVNSVLREQNVPLRPSSARLQQMRCAARRWAARKVAEAATAE